jgi:hypothetical protein
MVILANKEKAMQTGFTWDKDSKNIAAIFTMTDENGRLRNIELMESVFQDKSLGFESRSFHNKSSKFIYSKITELAKEVGENGTLLLYLNSHGGGSGSKFGMTSSDGWFKFSKALDAIAEGRKVKRLIVLVDTCHASGAIEEAFGDKEIKINPRVGLAEFPEIEDLPKKASSFFSAGGRTVFSNQVIDLGTGKNAYHEALIIASSSVEDLSVRGAFAIRLSKAFKKASENDEITVLEFMQYFASLHGNTRQKPYYKILPNDNMLNEPLFFNALIRRIPIIDRDDPSNSYEKNYVPTPK